MTTRNLLHDAGHCLRAATPPLLTLAVLTATRTVLVASPTPLAADGLLLPVLGAAFAAAAVWLVTAVCLAATRPLRDRRASQRLQHLRDDAIGPNHALVHVRTIVWSSAAGQQAVVVNVATGVLHRVWIPEVTVPIGAFVVLERIHDGARVVDMLHARVVESAHRHEARAPATRGVQEEVLSPGRSYATREDGAKTLIDEVEAYLKTKSP